MQVISYYIQTKKANLYQRSIQKDYLANGLNAQRTSDPHADAKRRCASVVGSWSYKGVLLMVLIKRSYILSLLLALSLFLLAACTGPADTGQQKSSLTLSEVLQKSVTAMQQLKTAHLDVQSSNSVQVNNANSNTSITNGQPTTSATPTNLAANIKGTGDISLPDQEQLKLTITQGTENTNVAQVMQGNKIYVQNSTGQWFVLDKSQYQGLLGNPFAGVQFDQSSLLGIIQNATITDHGLQTLNGKQLRHMTAEMDQNAVAKLFQNNPQLKSFLGLSLGDDILKRTKSFKATFDAWIDETTFYINRTEVKLNMTVDTTGAEGSAPSSTTASLDTVVDLSKFNEPVTITAPANATQTINPGSIFGTRP
jgi:hypothetical protein